MAPSQIQIATQVLQRLIKEEKSYYKELESQKKRIKELEKKESGGNEEDDWNRDFVLKQEKQAMAETNAVFPNLREKITNAREKLESYLDTATDETEREKAVEVIKEAKEAQKDDPISV